MKSYNVTSTIFEYESLKACPHDIQTLFTHAHNARLKAYAPYSNFLVGAALLLENNTIVSGSNQENASYPSGLCAERTAIYYAGAQYPDIIIKTIAICAGPSQQENTLPVPPCGACRQAIAEYEQNQKHPIEVYFMGTSGTVKMVRSLLELLPLAFEKNFLS